MSETSPLHALTSAAGAAFAEESGWLMPTHYGRPSQEYNHAGHEAVLFDLSHRGKIEVTGPEARSFLHNLCTNDILHLAPQTGCEAFFTSAKAKIVAHAYIYRLQQPGQ